MLQPRSVLVCMAPCQVTSYCAAVSASLNLLVDTSMLWGISGRTRQGDRSSFISPYDRAWLRIMFTSASWVSYFPSRRPMASHCAALLPDLSIWFWIWTSVALVLPWYMCSESPDKMLLPPTNMVVANPLFTHWTVNKFKSTVICAIWREVVFFSAIATSENFLPSPFLRRSS